MKQDFTGWRALWVHFEEDAKVAGYTGEGEAPTLSIAPSDDMTEGKVYFDMMQFVSFMSAKRHSDDQFVNRKNRNRVDAYDVLEPWQKLEQSDSLAEGELSRKEADSLLLIEQRLEQLILGKADLDMSEIKQGESFEIKFEKQLASAQKFYDNLNIKKENGVITGKPLFSSRDEQPGEERTTFQALSQSAFFYMAMDYQLASDEDKPARLEKIFNLFDHFAAHVEIHPGASGRFPYKNSAIDRFMLPAYAFMASAGGEHDKEMADAFARVYGTADLNAIQGNMLPGLTYYGSFGTLALMEEVYQETDDIADAPTGNFSFPYAAVTTHKEEDWVASVRGTSRYVWDFESGNNKNENSLGRYMSFGALMLFSQGEPLNLKSSGIDLNDGFHWGYVPGATTKSMPIENVAYWGTTTPKYLEGKHRNYTENTFVGSLSFNGVDGMFAMDFQDTVTPDDDKTLFDDSFGFKKSYFFIEDEIIALGSGISNDDQRFDTVTTLFQSKLTGNEPELPSVDGKAVGDGLDINLDLDGGVFSDPQGNYYIVPENYAVNLQQEELTSLQMQPKTSARSREHLEITRPAVKAFINHGSNPKDESYEYLLLPQSDQGTTMAHELDKGYEVIQKDDKAHIISHDDSGIVGYALFSAGETGFGPVSFKQQS